MRLGVEAALVDGQPRSGRRRGPRRPRRRLRARSRRTVAASQCRASSTSRSTASQASTSSPPTPRGTGSAGDAILETGVTAFLPTFITSPEEQLLAALREVPAESDGPRVLGAHLEGPFLSALRLGIHPAAARRNPDLELLERLLDAGPVRLVTLAPELPGASAVIERLLRREIAVSVRPLRRDAPSRRTRPSTSACGASRTSSTRCARSTTATPASSEPRSRGRTSSSS